MPGAEQLSARDGASGTHCHRPPEISLGMALSPEETAERYNLITELGAPANREVDDVWKLIWKSQRE